MNGRQAARKAAKRIKDMEHTAGQNKADIEVYNKCIQALIAGKSPCDYCEEKRIGECPNPDKQDHGCSQWWIRLDIKPAKEGLDDSEGIHGASSEG